MIILHLPWPPRALSPNARVHWGTKSSAARKYRGDAAVIMRAAGMRQIEGDGDIPLRITFRPPDNRRRDRDNMIASIKSGLDGIADAMGVDDVRFLPEFQYGEAVPNGAVIVEIGGGE